MVLSSTVFHLKENKHNPTKIEKQMPPNRPAKNRVKAHELLVPVVVVVVVVSGRKEAESPLASKGSEQSTSSVSLRPRVASMDADDSGRHFFRICRFTNSRLSIVRSSVRQLFNSSSNRCCCCSSRSRVTWTDILQD